MKNLNKTRKYNYFLKGLLIMVLLGATTVLEAKGTDFSGTWILNKEKSELGERGRVDASKIINQKGDSLIIKRTFTGRNGQEMSDIDKFLINGKECINKGFRNSERKSVLNWDSDGKILFVKSTLTMERDGEKRVVNMTEKFSLSTDGKVLTITVSSDRGEVKMVYDKK